MNSLMLLCLLWAGRCLGDDLDQDFGDFGDDILDQPVSDGLADRLLGPPCYVSGACNLSKLYHVPRALPGFAETGPVVSLSGTSLGSGDINGDGIADIIIGAPLAGPHTGDGTGKVYVVYGSRSRTHWGTGNLSLAPLEKGRGVNGFVIVGEKPGDQFGWVSSHAGDVNGDGIADLIMGSGSGKLYVVFGSKKAGAWSAGLLRVSTLCNGIRGFSVLGEGFGATTTAFATTLSTGNINGDRFSDVIVGAPQWVEGANCLVPVGKMYVIFGGNATGIWGKGSFNSSQVGTSALRGFTIAGDFDDGQIANAAASADINADGVADLIFSGINTCLGKETIWVVFGSNVSNAFTSFTTVSALANDGVQGFELVVHGVLDVTTQNHGLTTGDFNGDGVADIIIGIPFLSKTYVVFGSSSAWTAGSFELDTLGTNGGAFVLNGLVSLDSFGMGVATGDINVDATDDLVVGAPYANSCLQDIGDVYVIFGSSSLTGSRNVSDFLDGTHGFVLKGEASADFTGFSVASADINADGIREVIIGAPFALANHHVFPSPPNNGRTYVIFYPAVTKIPTKRPTRLPTHRPTRRPTSKPTRRPTRSPTLKPTHAPTLPGTLVTTYQFPFYAAVVSSASFCGGALIDANTVLTSAACCLCEDDSLNFTVYIDTFSSGAITSPSQFRDSCMEKMVVQSRVCHPDYNASIPSANNFCLLTLPFAAQYPPAQVDTSGAVLDFVTQNSVASAFVGFRANFPPKLPQLRKGLVNILDYATCNASDPRFSNLDGSLVVCASHPNLDPCFGDSGGPLFHRNGSIFYLVGVLADGPQTCGDYGFPAVFSRVDSSSFVSWLDYHTRAPTARPTTQAPTGRPSTAFPRRPTRSPTLQPTRRPTQQPTFRKPTRSPTTLPSRQPTRAPGSRSPSQRPTTRPTQNPATRSPTRNPVSRSPTQKPTARPTRSPATRSPTQQPSFSKSTCIKSAFP